MSLLTLPYPAIDPIIFQVGPLAIRWYSLAYICGLLFAWRYMLHLASRSPDVASHEDVDDFLVWATLGIVLGGRIGYTLFYNFEYYAANPLVVLQIWKGGMSFHGALFLQMGYKPWHSTFDQQGLRIKTIIWLLDTA